MLREAVIKVDERSLQASLWLISPDSSPSQNLLLTSPWVLRCPHLPVDNASSCLGWR